MGKRRLQQLISLLLSAAVVLNSGGVSEVFPGFQASGSESAMAGLAVTDSLYSLQALSLHSLSDHFAPVSIGRLFKRLTSGALLPLAVTGLAIQGIAPQQIPQERTSKAAVEQSAQIPAPMTGVQEKKAHVPTQREIAAALKAFKASELPRNIDETRRNLNDQIQALMMPGNPAYDVTAVGRIREDARREFIAILLYSLYPEQPAAVPEAIRKNFRDLERLSAQAQTELDRMDLLFPRTVNFRDLTERTYTVKRKSFDKASGRWKTALRNALPNQIKLEDPQKPILMSAPNAFRTWSVSLIISKDGEGTFHIGSWVQWYTGLRSALHRKFVHLAVETGGPLHLLHELDHPDPDFPAPIPTIVPAADQPKGEKAAALRSGILSSARNAGILSVIFSVLSRASTAAQQAASSHPGQWHFGLPVDGRTLLMVLGTLLLTAMSYRGLRSAFARWELGPKGLRRKVRRERLGPVFEQFDRAFDRAMVPSNMGGVTALRLAVQNMQAYRVAVFVRRENLQGEKMAADLRIPGIYDRYFDWGRVNRLFDRDFVLADMFHDEIASLAQREKPGDSDPLHDIKIPRTVLAFRAALDRGETVSEDEIQWVVENARQSQLQGVAITLLGERVTLDPDSSYAWGTATEKEIPAARRGLAVQILSRVMAQGRDPNGISDFLSWIKQIDPELAADVSTGSLPLRRLRWRLFRLLTPFSTFALMAATIYLGVDLGWAQQTRPTTVQRPAPVITSPSQNKGEAAALLKTLQALVVERDRLAVAVVPPGKLGPADRSRRMKERNAKEREAADLVLKIRENYPDALEGWAGGTLPQAPRPMKSRRLKTGKNPFLIMAAFAGLSLMAAGKKRFRGEDIPDRLARLRPLLHLPRAKTLRWHDAIQMVVDALSVKPPLTAEELLTFIPIKSVKLLARLRIIEMRMTVYQEALQRGPYSPDKPLTTPIMLLNSMSPSLEAYLLRRGVRIVQDLVDDTSIIVDGDPTQGVGRAPIQRMRVELRKVYGKELSAKLRYADPASQVEDTVASLVRFLNLPLALSILNPEQREIANRVLSKRDVNLENVLRFFPAGPESPSERLYKLIERLKSFAKASSQVTFDPENEGTWPVMLLHLDPNIEKTVVDWGGFLFKDLLNRESRFWRNVRLFGDERRAKEVLMALAPALKRHGLTAAS